MDLTEFDNLDLKKIIEKNCPDCIIMGDIVSELIPCPKNKEKFVHKFLDDRFKEFDLTLSFRQKVILIYREMISVETLLFIHSWFISRCCDINNIFLVIPHEIGIKDWYQNYLKLFGYNGFNIIECPYLDDDPTVHRWDNIDPNFKFPKKRLKYYFNFYGGTYSHPEREFLVTLLSTIPNGYIDFIPKFDPSLKELDGYLEQITSFSDRKLCDQLLEHRKTLTFDIQRPDNHQGYGHHGFIWKIDNQSACHVIRETSNDLPYMMASEKTIKPFLHFQFPLPISGVNSIQYLEELGFQMPHTVIDYQYQTETIFYNRVQKLCAELIRLEKTYTLDEMEDKLNDNREILQYNYSYIASGNLFRKVKNNLIRELND